MYCMKCGSKLEQEGCPNCGFVSDGLDLSEVDTTMQMPKNTEQKTRIAGKKPKWPFIVIAAAIVIGAACFLTLHLMRNAKYNGAVLLFDKGRIAEAATKFDELGGFRDSEKYYTEANEQMMYDNAVSSYEGQEYEAALELFEELGRYEESREYKKLCRENIKYIEAIEYYEIEEYGKAKRIFEDMPGFKDSTDMAFICETRRLLQDAIAKIDMGNYSVALKYLDELGVMIKDAPHDNEEIVSKQEVRYYQGVCFVEKELYYSAYLAFKAAGKYMDSSEQAKACIQPPVTSEFYRNQYYSNQGVEFTCRVIDIPSLNNYKDDVCIKIFDKNGELISASFIAYGEEQMVYLPAGEYYYEACYGNFWFGEKEFFGSKEFFTYDGLFSLDSGITYNLDF